VLTARETERGAHLDEARPSLLSFSYRVATARASLSAPTVHSIALRRR
jgi:hypothetical protein